eukprot:scaffold1834_cov331-Prasinococcus_capsulatus_cf.AAC.4
MRTKNGTTCTIHISSQICCITPPTRPSPPAEGSKKPDKGARGPSQGPKGGQLDFSRPPRRAAARALLGAGTCRGGRGAHPRKRPADPALMTVLSKIRKRLFEAHRVPDQA